MPVQVTHRDSLGDLPQASPVHPGLSKVPGVGY